jgi:hypothetical protein
MPPGPFLASTCLEDDDGTDHDHELHPAPRGGPCRSQAWLPDDLARLAQDFLERSAPLIDVVNPPPWEDAEDIFGGEVAAQDLVDYEASARSNLPQQKKAQIAAELMAKEARRYALASGSHCIALALTYRRILLDDRADPRDKVEILKRVYTDEEPEWMTAEIVYLHFVLLDQCRYLTRASASLERKREILSWVFTDPALEERPFSFKHCVRLVTGDTPDFGAVYAKAKEQLIPVLRLWIDGSVRRQQAANASQPELF